MTIGLTQGKVIDLEDNATSVSAAVDRYIAHRVSELSKLKRYTDDTSDKVRQYLLSNAEGTFLWVSLVCQELEKTHRLLALKTIESFPSGLDVLYERMMKQIQEEGNAEICMPILALMAMTYRPPSLAESTTLIGHPADDPRSVQDIVELCGSFFTVREDTIYFVHQSAKDFLLTKEYEAFNQILHRGVARQHHIIFSRSLNGLSRTLRRKVDELQLFAVCIYEVSPPEPNET
ncbi:hypothetical protein LY78DRAFT_577225 [Colletotrichum sublineola]|nr:hypothetical protein LY78DRAFT_577225 [Colletotrichum sublineola]